MTAGFEKQMPVGHEYVTTFEQYRNQLFGANRLTIAVRSIDGTIWTKQGLTRLYDVTQAIIVDAERGSRRRAVAVDVEHLDQRHHPRRVQDRALDSRHGRAASLTPEVIETIRQTTTRGGFDGTLVARDQSSALITAELNEYDKNGVRLDYIAYNRMLNERIRGKYEGEHYRIEIIGFAKQVGEIADGAQAVLTFCGIALLLVAAAVYWYCRSIRFTVLPIVCSLTSLVWQFGTLHLLGFGLDPLAILVPFPRVLDWRLARVQQINYIVREIAHGKSTFDAARASFLGVAGAGHAGAGDRICLLHHADPDSDSMVRELAVTASIGVGYKIVTNLVMLPVAASYCHFDRAFAERAMLERERRARWLRQLARVSEPRTR